MKIWRGLTVVPLRAVPARLARRSGRTRRIGGRHGRAGDAPWTGRAPRWGHGPGPSRHLASTGPINLTVPARLPAAHGEAPGSDAGRLAAGRGRDHRAVS